MMKHISRILILAILHLCWLTSYGWAEMLPTESAPQSSSKIQDDRQRLLDFLDRQEVVEELEKYGISNEEAVARINSLTDEEVKVIVGKLDELPPGADGVNCLLCALFTPVAFFLDILILPFSFIMAPFLNSNTFFVNTKRILIYRCGIEYEDIEAYETYPSQSIDTNDCDPGMESCPGI